MEDIRVDTDALREQIIKDAEKEGFIIRAYCPFVDLNKMQVGDAATPVVDVEGTVNPVTIAYMIKALEHTISNLKEKDGVREAKLFIDLMTSNKTFQIDRSEKENSDE